MTCLSSEPLPFPFDLLINHWRRASFSLSQGIIFNHCCGLQTWGDAGHLRGEILIKRHNDASRWKKSRGQNHTKYEVTIDIGYIKRSAKYGLVYLLCYYIQIGNERTRFWFDLCAIWMPDFWFLSILDPSSLWTVQMHSCIKYPIIWHSIHHYRHLRGRPHKNTPYMALTGELSSVFFKDFIRQLI